jgi:hypothetical protein
MILGIVGGWADGIATALPILAQAPARLRGTLEIEGLHVAFGSGGAGHGIPYGDWPITDDVGSWGARHGALAINHDAEVYDARLHRYREGVEIHADMSGGYLITEGCVAIERKQWGEVKAKIVAMIGSFGHAFLHIDPSGARIAPDAEPMLMFASAASKVEDDEPVRRHHRYARYHYRHFASR